MEVITAEQAAELIPDGATVIPGGFGSCGHPDLLTIAVEKRIQNHRQSQEPEPDFRIGGGQ